MNLSLVYTLGKNNNSCFSCLKPLVKTTIPFGQCQHFSQIEPSKKSRFFVVEPNGKGINYS